MQALTGRNLNEQSSSSSVLRRDARRAPGWSRTFRNGIKHKPGRRRNEHRHGIGCFAGIASTAMGPRHAIFFGEPSARLAGHASERRAGNSGWNNDRLPALVRNLDLLCEASRKSGHHTRRQSQASHCSGQAIRSIAATCEGKLASNRSI